MLSHLPVVVSRLVGIDQEGVLLTSCHVANRVGRHPVRQLQLVGHAPRHEALGRAGTGGVRYSQQITGQAVCTV